MEEDRRIFGISGDWSTTAFDSGVWYSTECNGGCSSAWAREDKNAFENRQRKREAEDKRRTRLRLSLHLGRDRRKLETFQSRVKRRRLHR